MKQIIYIILLGVGLLSHAQIVYQNRCFSPLIRTVTLEQYGKEMSEPVLYLNKEKKLLLQFDELSEETVNYEYTIVHCNSDWTQSNLDINLYLEGFEVGQIEKYKNSLNTVQRYVHYSQTIPSSDMRLLKSGNYAIKVFERNNPDKVIFTRRFYVVDEQSNIRAEIRQSSQTSLMKTHQEVNVKVGSKGLRFFQNPEAYMKVYVSQNDREDNKRELKMRGMSGTEIDYSFDVSNQFEGGNEFRNFDISSLRSRSNYVQGFSFYDNQNIAVLREERIKSSFPYSTEKDLNGSFLIRNEYNEDKNTYSDYSWVYFTLPLPYNAEGDFYVVGAMTDWRMEAPNLFRWEEGKYRAELYLKQGYYNYQILFLPKGSAVASYKEAEGNHYETHNNYKVFVYYRNFSDDYDELIGYLSIDKNK